MFTLHDDKFARDHITTHRLSLLILIKNYADICDGKHRDFPRMIWQDEFASKRHLDRSILSWVQQSNGSLKEMLRTVGLCSKVLHEAFKSMLNAICNYESVENMENFFSNLGYALFQGNDGESTLQKLCLLGLFCRRMLIYYERLAFCEIHPLFESFIKYCAPHVPLQKSVTDPLAQNVSSNESGITAVATDEMELESQSEMDSKSSRGSIEAELKASDLKTEKCEEFDSSEYFSRQQAHSFFHQQSALLEHNEADALSPIMMQQRIRSFLKSNPELTQAHFLSYLNSLRLGEFCGALDSLLMFMIRHNWKTFPNFPKLDDENLNKNQRYATLNLALLHLRFGHKEAALAATKESINLAHLSNDALCLQHSMALLHHLQPKINGHRMAEEVIKPAQKEGFSDLAFNAIQAHTNIASLSGGKPDNLFRNITASDVLHCTRPFTYFSMTSVTHKASLWRMYGKRRMSLLCCQVALAMQRTSARKDTTSPVDTKDVVLCLSHMIELLHEEGLETSSKDLLSYTKLKFPSHTCHAHYWRRSESMIDHTMATRLCRFTDASTAEQKLQSLDPMLAMISKAESLAKRDEALLAHNVLVEVLGECDITMEVKCKVLIMIAGLLSRNKSDCSSALRYLLEALSIATECHLHSLVVETYLKIAQLQLNTNSPLHCWKILEIISHECVANLNLHTRCRYLLVAVRCINRMKPTSQSEDIRTYINTLEQALQGFTHDLHRKRDVVYLLAKFYNKLFENGECDGTMDPLLHRDELAAEFRRLDLQLSSVAPALVV